MTTTAAPARPASRQADRKRVDLWVDVPFVKAPTASNGDLELQGYASTWGLDRDEEMVSPQAFEKSLSPYLSKNPIVLWQHNTDWPIGQITSGHTDDTGLYVVARIPNPGADAADWQKGAYTSIKNGIVRTFSIGGYMTRDVKPGPEGPVFIIVEVEWFETSCVSIPANADSIYEATVKALKGERPRLADKAVAQMEQLLSFKSMTDPELLAMGEEERAGRWQALAALFEHSYGVPAPPRDSWKRIDAARAAGVNPLDVARAVHLLGKAFYAPEPPAAAVEKAGRAISAANKQKLQDALAAHDDIEKHLVDAANSMKSAADSHADAIGLIRDVAGISDEDEDEGGDNDQREDEPPNSPEKAAGGEVKELHVEIDSGPPEDRAAAEAEAAEEGKSIEPDEDEDDLLAQAEAYKDIVGGAQYFRRTGLDVKDALPLANLPIAARDRAWDAGAAKRSVHGMAERDGGGFDPSVLSKAYLWRDNGAQPDQASSYRFIVVDVVDGALTYIPRGIFAAAGVAQGARGGTSDEIASAIKPALEKLYSRMSSKFDDPDIKPPWKD